MSTIDSAGNIHAHDGKFTGHIQAETDPAVLDEAAAGDLSAREITAKASLTNAIDVLTQAQSAVVAAAVSGAVARLRRTFPDAKRLVLVNDHEGGWSWAIDTGSGELEDVYEVEHDDEPVGSALEDDLWEWGSAIDHSWTASIAPWCVGHNPEHPWLAEGLEEGRRDGRIAKAEINLALFG